MHFMLRLSRSFVKDQIWSDLQFKKLKTGSDHNDGQHCLIIFIINMVLQQ